MTEQAQHYDYDHGCDYDNNYYCYYLPIHMTVSNHMYSELGELTIVF